MGQGNETVNFGGQEVKDQGHTRLKWVIKCLLARYLRKF